MGFLRGKRTVGAAIALVLVAAAAAGTIALRSTREQARKDALLEAADGTRSRIDDAIKGQLSSVEGRATAAASVPVLRAQLGVVDAATLKDGFSTEPWWADIRQEFPVYGVAAGATPEVLVGADGADFAELVGKARKAQKASSVVAASHGPLIAGAATATRAGSGTPYVVLVGKPLDAPFLDDLASRTRGAAALTDGKRVLLSAGPADESAHLKAAIGDEAAGLHPGEDWIAAASPIAPGYWLWSHARPRAAGEKPPFDFVALWVIALAGAAFALVAAFRKPAPGAITAAAPEEDATSMQSAPAVRSTPGTQPPQGEMRSHPGRTMNSDPGRSRTGSGALPARAGAKVPRPKQFGRYYLVDRLGEGGMAEVYTAVAFGAEKFRRAFVIKLLHSSAQRTEALVEMFIDEAKLAATLVHSNIIPVYDFGKMGDEYFMAQEYVLGRDLRRLVTRAVERDGKPLDPRLAVYVAREALRALQFAHDFTNDDGRPMKIVHRDVSPNNILVSARGEVKLFDFGIAKADEGRVHQTQTGVVKGNVQYMSPEQARGEPVDARADLCSLGLVLYFLLTGRSLYKGETAYQYLVQAATGLGREQLPSLEALPPQVAAVLRVALEPDREQRFQSALAFDNALSRLPCATGAELAAEVQRLFGDELKAEQAKFSSIEPPPVEELAPDVEQTFVGVQEKR